VTDENASKVSPTTVRDLRLLALTFTSGAVDAISVLALGKIFTAFMTGNLVFLGLGVAGAGSQNIVRVCVSLLTFAVGVFVGTRILRGMQESGTWPGYMSVILGAGAVAQAGFLALWIAVSGEPSNGTAIGLITLSAFAMGLQSSAALSLRVTGVFTTAATATLMYFVRDEAERSVTPASDRRRFAGDLGALVAGATAGALLLVHARTYAPVLPLALTALVVATGLMAPRSRDSEARGPRGDDGNSIPTFRAGWIKTTD
jgi:uncharacterized membrane protein YoaK (UPF0700 family)